MKMCFAHNIILLWHIFIITKYSKVSNTSSETKMLPVSGENSFEFCVDYQYSLLYWSVNSLTLTQLRLNCYLGDRTAGVEWVAVKVV